MFHFPEQILGAAKYSGSTLLQSATCQVTGFTKGSVWVVIQLTIENTENFVISADELETILKSEIAIYEASGEADSTYAYDASTLQVILGEFYYKLFMWMSIFSFVLIINRHH